MLDLLKWKRGNEGSVTIIALLILVILTLLGVSAAVTSRTEVQIAGNDRFRIIAFEHADSGVYITPKVISVCVENNVEQALAGVTYLGSTGNFYKEIMGFPYSPPDAPDLRFVLGSFNVDVDVDRLGTEYLTGGGTEFASGAEGIGPGAGGVGILFNIDSFGEGPAGSRSRVDAVYRKVVGVPGGL
jgi:hypothetical protein